MNQRWWGIKDETKNVVSDEKVREKDGGGGEGLRITNYPKSGNRSEESGEEKNDISTVSSEWIMLSGFSRYTNMKGISIYLEVYEETSYLNK